MSPLTRTAPAASPTPEPDAPPAWSFLKRTAFRFLFCYWLLYNCGGDGRATLPFPFSGLWVELGHAVSTWAAIHLFHLSGPVTEWRPTGSGDTALHYIYNLWILAAAGLAWLIWTALDRGRGNCYPILHRWLRVLLRYTLAMTMFYYGFAKVFPTQFRPPEPEILARPIGELSLHGMLWTFMGASMSYTILCGVAEVIAGALLISRRATPLGALISLGALGNIVALNFCYDTAVKLYSSNLFLMAAFLVLGDWRRLAGVLLFNRPAAAAPLQPLFQARWLRTSAAVTRWLFIGWMVVHASQRYQRYRSVAQPGRAAPVLYGIWEVERYARNGAEFAASTNSAPRWKTLKAGSFDVVYAVRTDGSTLRYAAEYGPKHVVLRDFDGGGKRLVLGYSQPSASQLVLRHMDENDVLEIQLRRVAVPTRLIEWRLHWVKQHGWE